VKLILSLLADFNVLSVRRLCVSQVHVVGMRVDSNARTANETFDLKSAFLTETFKIASMAPDPCHSDQSRIEACLRALVLDQIGPPDLYQLRPEDLFADSLRVLEKYNVNHGETGHGAPSQGWLKFEQLMEWRDRRFCITQTGYIGWVPQRTEPTDTICIFLGARSLYVLRPVPGSEHYRLIGECYIHGLMSGGLLLGHDERYRDFLLI
jgi:hypothetical protein